MCRSISRLDLAPVPQTVGDAMERGSLLALSQRKLNALGTPLASLIAVLTTLLGLIVLGVVTFGGRAARILRPRQGRAGLLGVLLAVRRDDGEVLGFLLANRFDSLALIYVVGASLFSVSAFFNAAKRASIPFATVSKLV